MKETKKKKIDAFLHEINSLLSAIPETPETEVCSRLWKRWKDPRPGWSSYLWTVSLRG